MLNREALSHLLFDNSVESTPAEATGSGWSMTYHCFLFNINVPSIFTDAIGVTNGFLIPLQLFRLLKPLYIFPQPSFFLGSSRQLIHFPPSDFSDFSTTLNFVLDTLSHFGIPASDPDPLARLIFSFANRHRLSATNSPVTLFISFTSTTVLHDQAEAADWVHHGTPESHVVRTLRITFESLRKLKNESLDLSRLIKSCCKDEEEEEEEKCMVCFQGFEEDATTTKRSNISQLSCSHIFHYDCIAQWLSMDHRCPICRYPMPWIHTFFPDVPLFISLNSTNISYLEFDVDDNNDEDDNQNYVAYYPYYSSRTTEQSVLLTILVGFLKKMLTISTSYL